MLTELIKRLNRGIGLGLILLMLGITLSIGFNPYDNLEIKTITFNNPSQQIIMGKIYLPKFIPPPFPIVIIGHGISNSKQHSHLLGVEFARSGIAAITFDFGGFGESYSLPKTQDILEQLNFTTQEDTEIIFNYLQAHPQQFNLNKIGIIGHSMGGNTALTFAQTHPEIQATVTLSFGSEVYPDTPKNLLFGVGLYEQLNPISRLKIIFQSALNSSENFEFGKIYGDFKQGNARQLLISPTADHFTSPFDSYLIKKAIIWTKKALQLPDQKVLNLRIHYFIFGQALIFMGGLMIGINLLYRHPFWIKTIAFLILGIVALNQIGILNSDRSSLMIIFFLMLIFLSNYANQNQNLWTRNFKQLCLYGILGLSVFFISTLGSNFSEMLTFSHYLLYFPRFFFHWIFFIVYNLSLKIRLTLTPSYSLNLTVSWLFWLLLITEILFPSKFLNFIGFLSIKIISWLRQPFRLGIGKLSLKQAVTLGLLGVILAIVITIRLRDGLLSEAVEVSDIFLMLFGQMLLFPIILTIFVIRSRWFRHLEANITKLDV